MTADMPTGPACGETAALGHPPQWTTCVYDLTTQSEYMSHSWKLAYWSLFYIKLKLNFIQCLKSNSLHIKIAQLTVQKRLYDSNLHITVFHLKHFLIMCFRQTMREKLCSIILYLYIWLAQSITDLYLQQNNIKTLSQE